MVATLPPEAAFAIPPDDTQPGADFGGIDMTRNLSTTLRRRRRPDPMQAFASLPRPLRTWMAQAVLPWSPASGRRIWVRARAEGTSPDDILDRLDRAEQKTLARDRLSPAAMSRTFINDQQDTST